MNREMFTSLKQFRITRPALLMKCAFILIVLFCSLRIYAQSDWPWARTAVTNGNGSTMSLSVSTDSSGCTFITGWFSSPTITFGSVTLTHTSNGLYDFFIVKYDPNGNVLWARKIGGINYEVGYSVCTDKDGNALVTGYYSDTTLTVGSFTLV
ncbi:MAG TPA: SBBP repeat-containing protein, partial [Bacteroidia bacterium]|nr:SBBP repeat-containing protein [Bacteroidia bacterium]